jgi:hypothetical protein
MGLVRDQSLECRSRGVPHRIEARKIENIQSHDAVARVGWGVVRQFAPAKSLFTETWI